MTNKLVSTNEAASILGVSRQFLERDRWLHPHSPRVPYIRIGERAVRYDPETLQNYIKSQTKGELVDMHGGNE